VGIEERPKDYGICKDHDRQNEFFCNCCSNAYCSECVVSEVQKTEAGKINHSMIKIDRAYSIALDNASKDDDALVEKKKVIEERLAAVTKKMKRIKENATDIQSKVTAILTETLEEMQKFVQKKSAVLKSDRHELIR
jgi:hypothetical protein